MQTIFSKVLYHVENKYYCDWQIIYSCLY